MSQPKTEGDGLTRSLGPWEAAAIVVGTIIGSGIFIVPGQMMREVGSPGMVLLVFAFGGLLSLAGALTYAELGAALPHAGGEYVYLREAYGPFWGFLYGWTQLFVAKSGSIAALATGFVLYAANFAPELETSWFTLHPTWGPDGGPLTFGPGKLLAIGLILSLGGINYLGVRVGGAVQTAMTALKIALILGLVGAAAVIGGGSAANLTSTTVHTGGAVGFFGALVAALWAYDGWNNLNMASGEVRRPHRNIPRALIGGVLAVMGVYAAANLAYFYVLSAGEVAATERVASEAARSFLGTRGGDAVALIAMVSIFAALNGSILSGARVPYAMARDGAFLSVVGRVHPTYRTPHVAIVVLTLWACLLTLSGRYEDLVAYVVFASWILYAMGTGAVFILRRKQPNLKRPYRTLFYPLTPALFILVAVALLAMTLVRSPRESLMGLGLIALGAPFYLFRIKYFLFK